jgi:hypothetical protein
MPVIHRWHRMHTRHIHVEWLMNAKKVFCTPFLSPHMHTWNSHSLYNHSGLFIHAARSWEKESSGVVDEWEQLKKLFTCLMLTFHFQHQKKNAKFFIYISFSLIRSSTIHPLNSTAQHIFHMCFFYFAYFTSKSYTFEINIKYKFFQQYFPNLIQSFAKQNVSDSC